MEIFMMFYPLYLVLIGFGVAKLIQWLASRESRQEEDRVITGHTQLTKAIADKHGLNSIQANNVLDRCLFDYDVITAVLNRADELMNEEE